MGCHCPQGACSPSPVPGSEGRTPGPLPRRPHPPSVSGRAPVSENSRILLVPLRGLRGPLLPSPLILAAPSTHLIIPDLKSLCSAFKQNK